ncbi:MAG: threonylcarbamoyl-AMP synthase [Bacteroidetes bacterium]|nr:threonylcarbamoyl-AMP synthase [Bacteroidota bacterium]MBS1756410.1 threonylcarbamoyl-AMP synthase [Bacteroidota bacterium]
MVQNFKTDIENCIEVLNRGGIILYPTDTVWGIGCDPTNADAVAKIYALKNRSEQKSMIILVADEKDIPMYSNQNTFTIFDYIKGIQKPVTVIYENAKNLAPNIINSDGSIAIRVVKDPFCKQLITRFGKPIVSTSSNVSGYPPPAIFTDIDIKIKNGVDYIVQHRQDDFQIATPSTILKIDASGQIIVIRQ